MIQVLALRGTGFTTYWSVRHSVPSWLVYQSGPDFDAPYTPIRFS